MNRYSKARIKGRDPTEPDSLPEELTDIEEMHRVDDKAILEEEWRILKLQGGSKNIMF